ncbi:hypothetical protein HPP92_015791 [Vanilla planifolia]|uniref:Uncharacterized protein n=1 Tax=Vanilla planifolia TaxID=51239 RepID=A0A835QDM3_VANPL|nr:hypothetical protein HPP92_015791 [Vanilla planifolia]
MVESVFAQLLDFDIGASKVAFVFLEELLIQLRELSKVGDLIILEVCMEIMDLLYETEHTSELFGSPQALAASVLVTAYFFLVPKQRWEFPLLPWVKFATSYDAAEIGELIQYVLLHVLGAEAFKSLSMTKQVKYHINNGWRKLWVT